MGRTLDGRVAQVCADYLGLADRLTPALVEGLYLQGSVALGDYRPGVSDIDFVAVTRAAPDVDDIAAIHARLRRRYPRPFFDGIYVRPADLRSDPSRVPAGVCVHQGRVEPRSRSERSLVT